MAAKYVRLQDLTANLCESKILQEVISCIARYFASAFLSCIFLLIGKIMAFQKFLADKFYRNIILKKLSVKQFISIPVSTEISRN